MLLASAWGSSHLRDFLPVLSRIFVSPRSRAHTARLPGATTHSQDPVRKTGAKMLLNFNYTSQHLAVSCPSEIVLIEVP